MMLQRGPEIQGVKQFGIVVLKQIKKRREDLEQGIYW